MWNTTERCQSTLFPRFTVNFAQTLNVVPVIILNLKTYCLNKISKIIKFGVKDQPFNTYAKFSEKLTFLTPRRKLNWRSNSDVFYVTIAPQNMRKITGEQLRWGIFFYLSCRRTNTLLKKVLHCKYTHCTKSEVFHLNRILSTESYGTTVSQT